tara:strand:+ start:3512 stop:4699 length:1188 start_codon:yes stop_codon:yes gene_type:complete
MDNLEIWLLLSAGVLFGPGIFAALLNIALWPRGIRNGNAARYSVSILIPARNEEQNLVKCVDSSMNQGAVVSEVLIYNDRSTDGTQSVIEDLTMRYAGIVSQVPTKSVRDGWAGKTNACARLSEHAQSKWMLFIDADTELFPNAVGSLVTEAEYRKATFLSAWPKIEMQSYPERLLMPLLNFVVFSLFPAPIARWRWVERVMTFLRLGSASLGLAHGACILVDRETYSEIGGHNLVKDHLFEDTALAREWRKRGKNSQVIDGRRAISVRMYSNFDGIWNGFTKNYYPAFQNAHSFALFQIYLAFAFLAFPVFILWAVISGLIAPVYLFLAIMSLAARLIISVEFGHPISTVPMHAIGVIFMLCLGFRSWWLYRFGSGVSWKGRLYKAEGMKRDDE